ncbi:MAG: hypothetical protein V3T77_09865, partial [Planctomycetota bacterium]
MKRYAMTLLETLLVVSVLALTVSCSSDSQPEGHPQANRPQANQSRGELLTGTSTRPAASTQKGTPDALQSLKERLQRDVKRLSSDADPIQL